VIRWKELDENVLDPTKWGWQGSDTGLRPIRTIKSVAPPEILKIIKCKCKMSSKNPCGTNLCSCRKNGIPCMPACGNCHGMDCNNKTVRFHNHLSLAGPEIWGVNKASFLILILMVFSG
uniref:Tesmin/TSO1-like CXC domain-containing protein n=1 Tax=Clytia hemisphaerica TaxID=252671 RepID=A0A7M5WJ49_9CNID